MTGGSIVAVSRILDLPFHERPAHELLRLEPGSDAPLDAGYAGYGWTRVDRIWLESEDAAHEVPVDGALVLALHSADDGERLADDIDLEFELGPGRDSVWVRATQFLARWLPQLPHDVEAIVLAMCNPFHATLGAVATHVPIHYAFGDAVSSLDLDAAIRLSAPRWGTIPP